MPVEESCRPHLASGGAPVSAQRERGGASVCLVAAGLVFVLAGLLAATVAAARAARQQAQVAADLGALAGAAQTLDGEPTACARAVEIVLANGATPAACRLDGLDLLVTVQVAVELPLGPARVATATARAGPVRA
ncbi:Rv3654c family TadE-like protein [Micromonospora nigra]|uniref:Rv3654c family TadE-like protein n=1 Tax=Micromonospora nigra TaxID=145857 RepID=UPI003CCC2654